MASGVIGRVAVVLLAVCAAAQTPDLDQLLAKIASYEFGQSREPLAQFKALVVGAPAARLKTIEARLLQLLQSKATLAGKEFALRELSLLGTDASVPVLARMLVRDEMSEMARYALARIPGPISTRALRTALDWTTAGTRIGIINSLGDRRDAGSVARLKRFLTPRDPAAPAAAAALANIGNQAALDALAEARSRASTAGWLSAEYLQCAAQLKAVRAYKQLVVQKEPENIRIAALGGLAEADPREAVPTLQASVDSGTPALKAAAIRFLSTIPGLEITTALLGRYSRLDAALQARLLDALADRGDASALPLFVKATKHDNAEVRIAALAGLGKLGGGTHVAVLAASAANAELAEQSAARRALHRLRGAGVDKAIIEGLSSGSGKERIELIVAAGERSIPAAAGALTAAVQNGEPEVRREALRALRGVAGANEVPVLVPLLEQSTSAADRREVAQTVAAAVKRSDAAGIATVVAAYKRTPPMPARLAMLEVLGQTSSDVALPVLRESLRDRSPEIVRGAILALTEWSTPAPLEDLHALAKSAPSPALSVLALRGYLKLLALPSDRSPAESAQRLGGAMKLARQTAEKRAVLALLAQFPSRDSLQIAEAAVQDTAVAGEARAAVERINSVLRYQ